MPSDNVQVSDARHDPERPAGRPGPVWPASPGRRLIQAAAILAVALLAEGCGTSIRDSSQLRQRLIHGLGVATAVTVLGALRAAGPLTANEPVRMLRITALNATLPVFPDGPVTVAVPVRRLARGPAAVVVSYAACSASVCLLPVIGHRIALSLS